MATIQKPAGAKQAPTPVTNPMPDLVPLPTPIPNGEAVAAFIAAGIGCLFIGIFTTLVDASAGVKSFMDIKNSFINTGVGPLSGKVIYSLVIWAISWAVLYFAIRGKNVNFSKGLTTALVLVGLGFLGTFPIVFEFIADSLKPLFGG